MLAVKVAKDNAQRNIPEVVDTVAKKIRNAGLFKEAAKLYEDMKVYKEAAELYIQAENWEKARKVAGNGSQQLQKHVEDLYKKHLVDKGQADLLLQTGNIREALDLYVRQENWEKVHEIAGMLGPDVEKDFSVRHSKLCLQEAKCTEAISILARYGVPSNGPAYDLCCFAAHQLLNSAEDTHLLEPSMQELRALLYDLVKPLGRGSDRAESAPPLELKRLLTVTNYMTSRYIARDQGLKEIEAKISISLLRYVRDIPADRAFYEAGMACREVGWENMAFLHLNRYLDVAEGIEDQDAGIATNIAEFERTDIPQDFPIPDKHYLEDDKREEVRDWVIQLSVDQQVEHTFTKRKCGNCKQEICVSNLVCYYCKARSEACCVTGYPVLEDERVACKTCELQANKSDWNQFVQEAQVCPWCRTPQQPIY